MRILLLVVLIFSLNILSFCEEIFPIKEKIIVTASLIPTEFSRVARKVIIIKKEDIERAPVDSVAELLKYVTGIDLRQRNPFGIQGDLSIRGANFSQVLIMINGIKIYDPQTAHHNLDIPLSLSDIERIEVLYGHGSSLYGENAFGGVINIVTKKSFQRTISGEISIGDYKTFFGNLHLSQNFGKLNSNFSIDYKKSNGFEYDRDFIVFNLLHNSNLIFSKGTVNFLIGYNKKNFGANNFYAPYPSKEWTETKFIGINSEIKKTKIKLYYRRHYDKFILDITKPEWYLNEHTTESYGIEAYSFFNLIPFGKIILGGEIREDKIKSSNLGNHSYYKLSIFSEYEKIINKLYLDLSLRSDFYSNYGYEFSPCFSFSYLILDKLKIRYSISKAFRIPSFTELYYRSPANIGNPNLKPEKTFSIESGIDYFPSIFLNFETTIFYRKDRDLIDWIRNKDELVWRAENIQEIIFYGIENTLKFKNFFSIGYSCLQSEMKEAKNFISKYVLNHPIHQISSSLSIILPFKINAIIYGIFKKRKEEKGYFVLDVKFTKKIGRRELFLKISNLLNAKYEEIPGVRMPGIWIFIGVKF
jgi:iron complex outermembrane receptor protein